MSKGIRPPRRGPQRGRLPGDSQYFRNGERFRAQYKDGALQGRIDRYSGFVHGWVNTTEFMKIKGTIDRAREFNNRSFAANQAAKQIHNQLREGQAVIADFYDYDQDTGDYGNILLRNLDDNPVEQKDEPDFSKLIRKGDLGQCSTAPTDEGQNLFFVERSGGNGELFAIGDARSRQGDGPRERPGIREGIGKDRQLPADSRLDRFDGGGREGPGHRDSDPGGRSGGGNDHWDGRDWGDIA